MMTYRMAAGQQKKRLTSSNLHDQYRGKKKKKLDSSDYMVNLRSHVALEWDDCQKRTVAKKEQVGIMWTDLAPFVDSVPESRRGVADIIYLPQEIFGLENLTEVLSYEVWATCLSESERKLLMQFLPNGAGTEQAVHSLLKGENHHFGNPYLKWSASLCSGNLHPDALRRMERQLKSNKRAYYVELNEYHTGTLEILKRWKKKWLSCKDPEKLWSDGSSKQKQGSLTVSAEKTKVLKSCKREVPQKIIRNGDITKYMSYIKITKTQHELVKTIKHSGDGIQSKLLTRVLGDIDNFHIQPYEIFLEEEKKRLHDHWLQVATKDLPASFERIKERKLWKEQLRKSVELELADKNISIAEKGVKGEKIETTTQQPEQDGDYENSHSPDVLEQEDLKVADGTNKSIDNHPLEHTASPNSNQEPSPVVVDQEEAGQDTVVPADNSPSLSESLGEPITGEDVMEPKDPVTSVNDTWQSVGVQDSYYHLPENHMYTHAADLSLKQPQLSEECPARMIDLERDIIDQEVDGAVSSAFNMNNGASLFCSFSNQERNELLTSFPKEPRIHSPYSHEHLNGVKQPGSGLQFLMANNRFPESTQFPQHFQDQQQLLEQRQVRGNDLYLQQIMNNNMYSSGRYPSQSNFTTVEQQNFPVSHSSANGSYNWQPQENRAHNNWSGIESASSVAPCLQDSGNADGSLFSVLSECNKVSSRMQHENTNSDQYTEARNFASGSTPSAENMYGYAHHLNNISSHEAPVTPSLSSIPWMSLPHQNPGMPGSMGRQYPRPWKR
ncbi:uncharacterized protein [Typha latifolia]|uniref:uncharacterized protein isoform X1 n=2 Tax=Typha latifolia TaxID=4733 RepID=UPI003C2AFA6A